MAIRQLTTRRRFVAASAVAPSPLGFLKSAVAQTAENADFLFVQSATRLKQAEGRATDRPTIQ
jgi:hypothetical protein